MFFSRTIMSSLDYLSHPFSISVFGGLMYWSEWDTHAIYQVGGLIWELSLKSLFCAG